MVDQHVTRFTVTVGGPAVGPGRLAARDVAEIARRIEQAIKRIGQVLYGKQSRGKGRKQRDIEQLCNLCLVSWAAGSAIAGFEIAEPPPQLSLFGNIGESSLDAFLQGLARLSTGELDAASPPRGFDTGVLETCESLAAVFDRGIDELTFSSPTFARIQSVTFNRATRERVRLLLQGPHQAGRVSKVGRLEVLNGHQGLSGRLWEADGTRWNCTFRPEHVDTLSEAWLKTVTVVGTARPDKRAGEQDLDVEAIFVHGAESSIPVAEESFWETASLEELSRKQKVTAAADLHELTASWPKDEVFDDALDELLRDRLGRRQAGRRETG